LNGSKENLRRVSVKVVENAIYEGIVNITHKLPEDSQDTGTIILFMEVGQDVYFTDGYILSAVNKAVGRATTDKYLRSSIVNDPIQRKSKQENPPAVIHIEYARGNRVKLHIMAKGAGAENISTTRMLPLSYASKEKIKEFVLDWVKKHVAKACPPVTVGIGIGGTIDYAPVIAKKALLRKIGSKNKNSIYNSLEKDILNEINKSGIGPQGIGGKTTAMAVFIETHPCHMASLPIAVNINCNSARITKIVI